MGKFKHHMQGDIRIDLTDKYFHFTGYIQLLDLNCHISGTRIALEDLLVPRDVSPAPSAYSWQGWEDHTEDEDGNLIQGDDWQGYSLPQEIEDARWELPVSLIEFYVYPLFRMPVELVNFKTAKGT
jgi:hypothetical protein